MAKSKNVNAPEAAAGVQETALANVPTEALSQSAMPAWLAKKMESVAPRGLERVTSDDIIYPRLLLMQGLSPLVADGKARVGQIIDNLTGDLLCDTGEMLEFIPVVMSRTRFFLKPIVEGGGMLCRSDDSLMARPGGCGIDQGGNPTRACNDCVHKEWNDAAKAEGGKGKPQCTMFYNIVGLLPGHSFRPVVWSGKSTSTKVMKRFLSLSKQTGADFFALKYNLFSKDETSASFKYKNWDFKPVGFVSEEEYKRGEQIYSSLKGKTWTPDTTDLETEMETETAASNKEEPF